MKDERHKKHSQNGEVRQNAGRRKEAASLCVNGWQPWR
ncbi:hypothetical protein WCP94_003110 [Bilophila wadsworthia]